MSEETKDQTHAEPSAVELAIKENRFLSTDEWKKLKPDEQAKYNAWEEEQLAKITEEAEKADVRETKETRPPEKSEEKEETEETTEENSEVKKELSEVQSLKDELARIKNDYAELLKEFHRRNRERSETEQDEISDETSRTKSKLLAKLKQENPEVVEALKELLKEELAPIEKRSSLQERTLLKKVFADEMYKFKTSIYASKEANELAKEIEALFNDDPNKFGSLLLSQGSLAKELEKEFFARHPDRAAELRILSKRNERSKSTQSSKKEVDEANIGKKSSSSTEPLMKTLEYYQEHMDEFRKLPSEEMEKLLPHTEE